MAEPMPPKRRISLSEVLTIDDLINFVSMKAHTRRGRVVVGASSAVILAAIIFAPIIIRSNQSAGPSSTPAVPVVTVPPTNSRTAIVAPILPLDSNVNDRNRYGGRIDTATPTTAPAPRVTTPPATTAPAPVTPATTPATFPPQTFPPQTFPPATNPPATTPPTSPPLTVPPGGVITPG